MKKHERAEGGNMSKYAFIPLKGSELVSLVEIYDEVRVIPLEDDEPVVVLVNRSTLKNVDSNKVYLALIPYTQIMKSALAKAESEQKSETSSKEEEKKEEEKSLIEELFEKVKWVFSEESEKLPFNILSIDLEYEKDIGLWSIKFRIEKKGSITLSLGAVTKFIRDKIIQFMRENKYPDPILLVVSMEGKVIYTVVDVVLDDLINAILSSRGIILKNYVIVVDIVNDILDVNIIAEKSLEAKVGIFSGYKIAEEIGKVVKERLKWKHRIRVKLKVGLFDYVKVI